jgi:hypothetical protein
VNDWVGTSDDTVDFASAGSSRLAGVVDSSAFTVGLTTLVAPSRTRSNPALAVASTVPMVDEPMLKTATAGATARRRTAAMTASMTLLPEALPSWVARALSPLTALLNWERRLVQCDPRDLESAIAEARNRFEAVAGEQLAAPHTGGE